MNSENDSGIPGAQSHTASSHTASSEERALAPAVLSLQREVAAKDSQRSAAILAGILSLAGVGLGFGIGHYASANSNYTVVEVMPPAQLSCHRHAPARAQRQPITWLGVEVKPATHGVSIAAVVPGSPAQVAGFVAGQTIAKLGDTSVTSPAQFIRLIRSHKPGDTVAIVTIDAKGAQSRASVDLGVIEARALGRLRLSPRK